MGLFNAIYDKLSLRPLSADKPWDDLSGNVVIVTGSSHGLGKAIAKQLYRHGASLVLISRHLSDLDRLYGKLDNSRVLLIEADVTTPSAPTMIIKRTFAHFGKVDVLINNVGVFSEIPFAKITRSQVDNSFRTNFYSVLFMSQAVLPFMKERHNGLIINIGSRISNDPQTTPHKVLYASTKYALVGFSRTLSREVQSDGIRVTCLMPGEIRTYLTSNIKNTMDPNAVADFIYNLIRLKKIHFESVILKSI